MSPELDATRAWQYQFMLPPGWVHIPLDGAAVAAIDRLLAERFARAGRDQVAPLRRALRTDLLTLADDARCTGALDLYLLLDSPGDLPVDASLVVTLVTSDGSPSADLLAALGDPASSATSVALRFAGTALRYETRRPTTDPLAAGGSMARVQYLVNTPAGSERLLLTFVTTTAPIADQLVTLFDAMAATLGFTDRAPVS